MAQILSAFAPFLALFLAATGVFAQNDRPIPPYNPDSEQACEQLATNGAEITDNPELAEDIANGSVDVFVGDMPPGINAFSFFDDDGVFVILIEGSDLFELFASIAHEWWHKNNPTGNPPLEPKARLQWESCQEAGALTYSLQQLKKLADQNQKPPCSLIDKINSDLGWESLRCAQGPDAMGPPNPNPSGLEIDCTE